MGFLNIIFFGFLGVCLVSALFRTGKIIVKAINKLFDWIEAHI